MVLDERKGIWPEKPDQLSRNFLFWSNSGKEGQRKTPRVEVMVQRHTNDHFIAIIQLVGTTS